MRRMRTKEASTNQIKRLIQRQAGIAPVQLAHSVSHGFQVFFLLVQGPQGVTQNVVFRRLRSDGQAIVHLPSNIRGKWISHTRTSAGNPRPIIVFENAVSPN